VPTNLANSDGRDAIFFGGDFDYPSERFRLFGGVDYFMLQDATVAGPAGDVTVDDDSYILLFNMGAGLRFSVFELGAAAILRTRTNNPGGDRLNIVDGANATGSHAGTIAPYLKISPPSIPVSLFVQGAVMDQYEDYGYAIGGGNDIKPSIGFTAGLTIGFE
jgi:hypothetical protein